jgi:hypothetical protein
MKTNYHRREEGKFSAIALQDRKHLPCDERKHILPFFIRHWIVKRIECPCLVLASRAKRFFNRTHIKAIAFFIGVISFATLLNMTQGAINNRRALFAADQQIVEELTHNAAVNYRTYGGGKRGN